MEKIAAGIKSQKVMLYGMLQVHGLPIERKKQ